MVYVLLYSIVFAEIISRVCLASMMLISATSWAEHPSYLFGALITWPWRPVCSSKRVLVCALAGAAQCISLGFRSR